MSEYMDQAVSSLNDTSWEMVTSGHMLSSDADREILPLQMGGMSV